MISQQSGVSSQESVIDDKAHQAKENKIRNPESGFQAKDIKNKKDEFKKVAKEMESLFAYQLLKTMRETTDNMSDEKKENGYDTYMSLFDMEVSKALADRGLGLQDSVVNWLERTPGINDNDNKHNE